MKIERLIVFNLSPVLLLLLILNENCFFLVHFKVMGKTPFLRANRNKNNYSVCVKSSVSYRVLDVSEPHL